MPGSFSYESSGVSPARRGISTQVFKYDADMDGVPGTLTPLPNVVCIDVEMNEAEPGAARFRYVFDEYTSDPADPSRVEHVYPLDASGPRVVHPGDRLVVYRLDDSGGAQAIFDGHADLPQADINDRSEHVTFTAMGTQNRQWDRPLGGAYMRDQDHPTGTTAEYHVPTGMPARFNPDGHPNASPGGTSDPTAYDCPVSDDDPSQTYPAFFGPIYPATEINGKKPRLWTLGMAFRYLLARGCRNDDDTGVTHWFKILDWDAIDGALKAMIPKAGGGPINWPDESTYDLKDIIVQDLDVTGEAWPDAAQKLLEPHGFTMLFRLRTGADLKPEWWLEVYRKDINLPMKSLYLQAAGSTLDPGLNNLWKLRLARDSKAIKNRIVIDTAPTAREASFVLAPLFVPEVGDVADIAARDAWKGNQKKAGTDYRKYREWGFDEVGEGHWVNTGVGWTDTVGDLEPLLKPPLTAEEEASDFEMPERPFVHRRRKPLGHLVSRGTDPDGKATVELEPELWASGDYAGGAAKLWDGTGTWHKVPGGSWSLLPDRIGIRFTTDDLEKITIGKPTEIGAGTLRGDKINILKSTADPAAPENPYLFFRLTCAVEDDRGISYEARRRDASPTPFTIERRVDARDRFKRTVISHFSHFHPDHNPDMPEAPDGAGTDVIVRDDFTAAYEYAQSLRRAHERASFAGTATCPRFTDAYEIGDKVGGIVGRGLSLRTNAGGEQGESDTYPVVVSIRYTLDGDEQATQLTLSDHRAEPARRRQR